MKRIGIAAPPRSGRAPLGFALVLAVLGVTGATQPVVGQEVVGETVDDRRTAVGDVAIILVDMEGRMVANTLSDDRGRFSLVAPEEGRYSLRINRLGYRPLSGGPYLLAAGVALEVFVVMHRQPTLLEGVEVEVEGGQSSRLAIRGFYEREAEGFGHFYEREEIERLGVPRLTDLLNRLPQVTMSTRAELFGPESIRNPGIVFERRGLACSPALWIDGVLRETGGALAGPLRIDDFVGADETEGIEVYVGPASTPIEFSYAGSCGVIVIWTRGRWGG